MDLTAIQAAISSLRVATSVAKSILETKNMVEVQSKVIEIQSALLEAQSAAMAATSAQFELQQRVKELEEALKAATAWGEDNQRYALVSPFRNGGMILALKESLSRGEVAHFLCPNCFGQRKKSYLAPVKGTNGWLSYSCSACRFSMETGFRGIGDPQYAEHYAQQA